MLENKNTLLFGSYQHTFTLRDISAWFNNGPTHIHVPGRAITETVQVYSQKFKETKEKCQRQEESSI
jgi:hypothetical protein